MYFWLLLQIYSSDLRLVLWSGVTYKSQMSPECLCKVSAQTTAQSIYNYHFENAHFEWKQKHADFHDMSPLKFGHVPPR